MVGDSLSQSVSGGTFQLWKVGGWQKEVDLKKARASTWGVLRHFNTQHFADDTFATHKYFDTLTFWQTDILTPWHFADETFCHPDIMTLKHFDIFIKKKNIYILLPKAFSHPDVLPAIFFFAQIPMQYTLTHGCLKVHGGVPIVLYIFVDPL